MRRGPKPKHGHATDGAVSPEYQAWLNMRARCDGRSDSARRHYVARGITVCDRWATSFEAFLADVGPRPSPEHSIDRIDNEGNYEPGNVRWATRTEQARNTRTTRIVEVNGVRASMAEWAERTGISLASIYDRISRGWSVERAVSTPRDEKRTAKRWRKDGTNERRA